MANQLYVLRFYDMFDGWIDVSGPLPKAEADELWDEKTSNGTRRTKFEDGDYYKVFPADTQMIHTPEFRGR
jgi:hypothetical protein